LIVLSKIRKNLNCYTFSNNVIIAGEKEKRDKNEEFVDGILKTNEKNQDQKILKVFENGRQADGGRLWLQW